MKTCYLRPFQDAFDKRPTHSRFFIISHQVGNGRSSQIIPMTTKADDVDMTSKLTDEELLQQQQQQQKQQRDRRCLFVFNVLTTFLFVGATLGWGPMQLLVSD